MTRNQIEFQKLQEQKRSNQVNESVASGTLAETIRNHQKTESQTDTKLGIDISNLNEYVRSNQARETETHRSNLANELISRERNAIQQDSNAINDWYNKARINVDTSRLSFEQQKEWQRIQESVRDYNLAVKNYEEQVRLNDASIAQRYATAASNAAKAVENTIRDVGFTKGLIASAGVTSAAAASATKSLPGPVSTTTKPGLNTILPIFSWSLKSTQPINKGGNYETR